MSGWRYDEYAAVDYASRCVGSPGDAGTEDVNPSDASDAIVDAPPGSVTYVFGEGTGATHTGVTGDTYVSTDMETVDQRPNNFGGDNLIKLKQGEDHGLIRVTISAIPTNATVLSATLRLHISDPGSGSRIEIRPLLESWLEGNLQGTAGQSNWTYRDATNLWTTAGAAPTGSAGAVATTFQPTAVGSLDIGLPPSLVQSWVDGAGQNHGMLLLPTQDKIDVTSSEGSSSNRPRLTVTFLP